MVRTGHVLVTKDAKMALILQTADSKDSKLDSIFFFCRWDFKVWRLVIELCTWKDNLQCKETKHLKQTLCEMKDSHLAPSGLLLKQVLKIHNILRQFTGYMFNSDDSFVLSRLSLYCLTRPRELCIQKFENAFDRMYYIYTRGWLLRVPKTIAVELGTLKFVLKSTLGSEIAF